MPTPKPLYVTKAGKTYKATVFRIHEHDEFGRPKSLTMHPDDEEKIHLEGGEHFLIAYVPLEMCKPQTKGRA